jgi:uncharacterized membrane protein YccC
LQLFVDASWNARQKHLQQTRCREPNQSSRYRDPTRVDSTLGTRREIQGSARASPSRTFSSLSKFFRLLGQMPQVSARACGDKLTLGMIRIMKLWSWKKENLPSIWHAIRTAVAATLSVLIARLVGMPEAYWAAIATLVVMQSTLGATVRLSIERIVATALGASVGAIEANYFGANLIAFAVAVFLLGLMSFAFRLEKTAYRYASITLAIIVLIPRTTTPWSTAAHRFIEVSVGILVALAMVAVWREEQWLYRNAE